MERAQSRALMPANGIHHVTAICSEPSRSVAFYEGVLGQRLVKQTVNFDDPHMYHLYFADEAGTPGTVLTFFPLPGARRGGRGVGEIGGVAYAVAPGSLAFWRERLGRLGVPVGAPVRRFGLEGLRFPDPDGLMLELVADPNAAPVRAWAGSDVPEEHALRGFHGVTLWVADVAPTGDVLGERLGYRLQAESAGEARFASVGGAAAIVDVRALPDAAPARPGAGSVHHVAFRVADEAHQASLREGLLRAGHNVTSVRDRQYFRSVYFREPGGVLFELATDGPGFTIDETVADLGGSLRLPPWFEPRRQEIEAVLPPLGIHAGRESIA